MSSEQNQEQSQSRTKRLKVDRNSTANTLMVSFIIMTSIGGFLISPPVGFLIAGATCGLFGFLLGLE